ncbi:transglycosylase SLT domain-containing protein [Glutamicibacter ardleyensis]|uniref:transglycosylase SLT domain-containing protein n=1 Tax=Glutamicibacter ardleyensis TaxID=225894 RepID=UPI003FD684ED
MDQEKKTNAVKQFNADKNKAGMEAVKGFVKGGVTGAIAGGVKGTLKTKTGKKMFFSIIALAVVASIIVGGIGFALITTMISQETESTSISASNGVSLASMNQTVGDEGQGDVQTIMNTSESVEWEIMVALWTVQKKASGGVGDFQINEEAIADGVVSQNGAEGLESSTTFLSRELARLLREKSTKDLPSLDAGLMESTDANGDWVRSIGDDDGSRESAEYAKTTYISAINDLPLAGIEERADEIYSIATGWRTGESGAPASDDNVPVCTPSDTEDSNDGTVYIPEKYKTYVEEASRISGLSENLIATQINAESSWNPRASSGVAFGIAQFKHETFAVYGNGGDIWDPADAIPALGRYMKFIKDKMEPIANGDEDKLVRMTIFGYHNGPYAIGKHNNDFDKALSVSPRGKAYVEKIMAGANGTYTADCTVEDSDSEVDAEGNGAPVAKGTIVETSAKLAWDKYVEMPYTSSAYAYGKTKARPEFVEASSKLSKDWHTAYFTDCGVFVSTVMRTSGADPTFPKRSTTVMLDYVRKSAKYDTFYAKSEADLKPGDILVLKGHIYLYTGKRNDSATGRAQGASLTARPPAGHYVYLSDRRGQYTIARLKNQD